MCGRYYVPEQDFNWILEHAVRSLEDRCKPVKRGEVSPGDAAAVVANDPAMRPSVFSMNWGYRLGDGTLVFNARSETARDKKLFSDGMRQRRCLIPAWRYFEWEHVGKEKRKYSIAPEGSNGFYLGGIYRMEVSGPAFSVLTRSPVREIEFIHDRMPVIIPEELTGDWLNPKYNAAEIVRSVELPMYFAPAEAQEHGAEQGEK